MSNIPLNVAFVGGGLNSAVGLTHKIALEMDGNFKLVAGCFSRNSDVNKSTGEQWGISSERVHDSWQTLLKMEQNSIDAIIVLTPTPSHREIVIGCIETGVPVICEKALAVSVNEAEDIRRAVIKHNGRLGITYNYTGYPMLRELKHRIVNGELGKLEQILIEMPQEGYARVNDKGETNRPQEWRLHDGSIPTLSLDLGVHLHQIVDFLTEQKPISVIALNSSFGAFNQVVDNIQGLAQYTNNLVCNFWYGKAALGNPNGLRVRVFGDKGSAEWYQMNPEFITLNDCHGLRQKIDRTHPKNHVANLTRYSRFKAGHPAGFIEAFANYYTDLAFWLRSKKSLDNVNNSYVFGLDMAHEGLKLLEAVHYSAKNLSWEKI